MIPNLLLWHASENLLCGWVASLVKGEDKRHYNIFLLTFCFLIDPRSNILICMALTQHAVYAFLTSRASIMHRDKHPEIPYCLRTAPATIPNPLTVHKWPAAEMWSLALKLLFFFLRNHSWNHLKCSKYIFSKFFPSVNIRMGQKHTPAFTRCCSRLKSYISSWKGTFTNYTHLHLFCFSPTASWLPLSS